MPDPNLGQITATVWESVIGKSPNDNIFNSRAFFFSLAGGGASGLKKGAGFEGREASAGGRVFDFSLEYVANSTFKSYSEMEQLDTTRVDNFDAARYDWKINAGTVVWSDLEELRAQADKSFNLHGAGTWRVLSMWCPVARAIYPKPVRRVARGQTRESY
jgi:hypothetical protein